MKNIILITLLLAVSAFQTACNKNGEDENCPTTFYEDISVQNLGDTAYSSTRVSVLLKLDTRDGTPLANLKAEQFSIWEKKAGEACYDEINPFEANRRIAVNPQRYRHSTLLVLDLSKSITQQYLNDLKNSAKSFVQSVMPDSPTDANQMAIWWFDGSKQLFQLKNYTSSKTELVNAINAITATTCVDCNSTNLFGATIAIADEALKRYNTYKNDGVLTGTSIVIFTDGDDEAGWNTYNEAANALNKAQLESQKTVRIFTIGLGSETNLQNLRLLGRNGFSFATDKSKLEATFAATANSVKNEANSYYIVEYCSPKRTGRVQVRVVAASAANKKGTLSFEFDAGTFKAPFNCQ